MTPRTFEIVLRPAELARVKAAVKATGKPERMALAELLLSACEPCSGCVALDVEVESLRDELAVAKAPKVTLEAEVETPED